VGGKVNGRNVPIKHVLANGDRVSVLTSRNQKPKSDWLSFAVTSKARGRIRQALSDEKLKDAADGREMLMRRLKNWKIEYNDALVRSLIDHYKMPAARDLYYQIFHEKIDLLDIKEFIRRRREKDGETDTKEDFQSPARHENAPKTETEGDSSDYLVIENSVEGLDYRLSPCCNPVFGDRVFGFVTITEGIKIHRTNCPNAPFLMANYPYRIVPARWTEKREESASFRTSVRVTGVNDLGVITRIHEMLASYRITLRNFNYENRDGMFEGIIDIYVPNVNTLNGLIKNIQSIKGVVRAARYEK
jgi:GTP pyrophosphokinase